MLPGLRTRVSFWAEVAGLLGRGRELREGWGLVAA